jgi:hypothetical protein
MSYSFACNWQAGVIMDPANKHRVGYLTEFNVNGLPTPLAKDLSVRCPYTDLLAPAYQGLGLRLSSPDNQEPLVGSVVAALQTVSWGGGVGDVFSFSCYMSHQNAQQLKILQTQFLKTTNIYAIGWWITNFDPASKTWFEELYPKSPAHLSGKINVVGKNVRLQVSLSPVKVSPNADVYVYSVSFELAPSPDIPAIIHVASSSSQHVERPWGHLGKNLGS